MYTNSVWLTLCHKPINYSFRNKTGWICWDYCPKLSNTPQWRWCRPNLERHKKNLVDSSFYRAGFYLYFADGVGDGERNTNPPQTTNSQNQKRCKNYCPKPIWLNFVHCMYIYVTYKHPIIETIERCAIWTA